MPKTSPVAFIATRSKPSSSAPSAARYPGAARQERRELLPDGGDGHRRQAKDPPDERQREREPPRVRVRHVGMLARDARLEPAVQIDAGAPLLGLRVIREVNRPGRVREHEVDADGLEIEAER